MNLISDIYNYPKALVTIQFFTLIINNNDDSIEVQVDNLKSIHRKII